MRKTPLFTFMLSLGLMASAGTAQAETPSGKVSVAQVLEAVSKAPRDKTAREMLTAYMTGIAETMKYVKRDNKSCKKGSMDGDEVVARLKQVTPDASKRKHTPATPIIVRLILKKAGC